jgi:hypothetical protein
MHATPRHAFRLGAVLLVATPLWVGQGCSDAPGPEPPRAAVAERSSEPGDPFELPRASLRFVNDEARVLGPYEHNLEQFSLEHAKNFGLHIYVATTRDGDASLSVLAPDLLDSLEAQEPGPSGSVLILVEAAARRARVEVSYELEQLYPDAFVGNLVNYQLAPYASYRAVGMAVADASRALIFRAIEAAVDGTWQPPDEIRNSARFLSQIEHASGGAGAFARIPLEPMGAELKMAASDEMRRRLAPSPFAGESIDALILRNRELVGDPTLDLLTPGSQCQARFYPFAAFEAWKRADLLEDAKPLDIRVVGDRAVARPARPLIGLGPVFLHRIGGTWRIDAAELYKSVFWTTDGDFILRNERSPYAFGLRDLRTRPSGQDLSAIDLGDEPLADVLARLEAKLADRPSAEAHVRYAELLLRNCNASVEALAHYRAAARLAPSNREILELTADRHLYFSFWMASTPYLAALGPDGYPKLAHAFWYAGRLDDAERYYLLALQHAPTDAIRRSLVSLRRQQAARRG